MEDRIPPKFLKLLDYSAILPIDFFMQILHIDSLYQRVNSGHYGITWST